MEFCAGMEGVVIATVRLFAVQKTLSGKRRFFKVDKEMDRFDKSISLFGRDTFPCKVATKDTDGDAHLPAESSISSIRHMTLK
ncbi:MAG: hypothetical protein V4676_04930 [Bacteroidota bacterium]